MRAAKYRAWDTKDKRWMDDEWTLNQPIWELNAVESRYAWVQWTGLTDRNGVEIYEGDIVKINGVAREVIWSDAYCGFRVEGGHGASLANIPTIEVIGNIYENPELLKEAV